MKPGQVCEIFEVGKNSYKVAFKDGNVSWYVHVFKHEEWERWKLLN